MTVVNPREPSAPEELIDDWDIGSLVGGVASELFGIKSAEAMPVKPFFSALGKLVDEVPLKTAPAEQWLGTIKNTPGVKAEELEWTGIEDAIKAHKGQVDKQWLVDYVRNNTVDVQEVVKGASPAPRPIGVAPNPEGRGFVLQLPDGSYVREQYKGGFPLFTAAGVAVDDDDTLGVRGALTEMFGIRSAEAGFKISPRVTKPLAQAATKDMPPAPAATIGLSFPEKETAANLRSLTSKAGAVKNKRTEIQPPVPEEGVEPLPTMVVGDITPEDWIARTEHMLTPAEIVEAAKWYHNVRGEFMKYSDGDEALADQYMKAWLVAQQNVSPEVAMNNVLMQAEQLARGIPEAKMRAGGMPMPTHATRRVLKGEEIDKGVGIKISDFVDSAVGKSVRSWMANQPEGGAPFTVDVHSARDTGAVDDVLIRHLARLGYNPKQLKKLELDFAGSGVPKPLYENRARFGRELTDHLNKINWHGRNNWQPKEIQAVGWMAMTKLTGGESSGSSTTALEHSLRRISYEVAPGDDSPWAKKFGEEFSLRSGEEKERITEVVTEHALDMAQRISGVDVRKVVHGMGGWRDADSPTTGTNPSAVAHSLATRDGAEITANILGYLLNQTEVWVNSVKNATASPKAFAVDFIEVGGSRNLADDDMLRRFWEIISSADTTKGKGRLFGGFQPITTADGDIGIRVVVDKGGTSRRDMLISMLADDGPVGQALKELNINIESKLYEADVVKARNSWKDSPDGKVYLQRLSELGVRRPAAHWGNLREELTRVLERELRGEGGAKSKRKAPAKGRG